MGGELKAGYERNDRFDRLKRIKWIDYEKISKSAALLLGAGALGNEVAKNLLFSGFDSLTIVDFDVVERSNLPRCIFFSEQDADKKLHKAECLARGIQALSSDIKVQYLNSPVEDLSGDVFSANDIIFGCLDNINSRMHANAYSRLHSKPYIDSGMDGTIGRIFISIPPDGPCLECASNASHSKISSLRFSCSGSDIKFFRSPVPAEITTTSIVSALAVKEGVRLLSSKANELGGQMIYYDGLRNTLELLEVDIDPACSHHGALLRGGGKID